MPICIFWMSALLNAFPVRELRRLHLAEAPALRLLVIDDDSELLGFVARALESEELEIITTVDAEEGLDLAVRLHPEIVLLDWKMPQRDGMELLENIVEADPRIDVILMTGYATTEAAVAAIQKGACDFLEKPFGVEDLRRRIHRLAAEARLRRRTLELERQLLRSYRFEGMVGRSPLMLEVFARIRRVAPHFRTVLVTGATGTGKELAARALHRLSPVGRGPFVVCNCNAIVPTLIESELFGYVRGAFTGAAHDKMGLVEYASGGTLFLDEIGDMPLDTQARLLRVLQNQEIQRVGSPETRRVEVRVIAATHRDLRALAAEQHFREDLYYRLSMVEVHLPRLIERREDLPLLERHFLECFGAQYRRPIRGLTRRAQALLARYPWPGNVRELENALGHACMMTEGETVDVADLPESLRVAPTPKILEEAGWLTLSEVERRHALRVLESVDGNKLRAAEILGISRMTLYRLLRTSAGA